MFRNNRSYGWRVMGLLILLSQKPAQAASAFWADSSVAKRADEVSMGCSARPFPKISLSDSLPDYGPDAVPPPRSGEYSLVLYAGAGYSYYAAAIGIPATLQQVQKHRSGFPASVRLMWHPNHRLRVGLESGWTSFYSYTSEQGSKRAQVYLSAVPMLLVWSMPIASRFHIFGGLGTYLVNSHLDDGSTVNVNTFSMGWMLASSYVHPISRNLGVAAEVKWMNATETDDANFVLQVQLVWKFFRW